jgi:hypothetical protein
MRIKQAVAYPNQAMPHVCNLILRVFIPNPVELEFVPDAVGCLRLWALT